MEDILLVILGLFIGSLLGPLLYYLTRLMTMPRIDEEKFRAALDEHEEKNGTLFTITLDYTTHGEGAHVNDAPQQEKPEASPSPMKGRTEERDA